jgi:hypothetical protein
VAETWVDIWNPNYPGSTQFTSASGQFLDAPFGACTLTPFVDTFTQPISMPMNGRNYTVRTNSWTFTLNCGRARQCHQWIRCNPV